MATAIIDPETRRTAEHALNDVEEDLLYYGAQIRAIATAIEALLPEDAGNHPLLKTSGPGEQDDALAKARYKLRDGIKAVRTLAVAVDNCGCTVEESVVFRLQELRDKLGLAPSPEMASVANAVPTGPMARNGVSHG